MYIEIWGGGGEKNSGMAKITDTLVYMYLHTEKLGLLPAERHNIYLDF